METSLDTNLLHSNGTTIAQSEIGLPDADAAIQLELDGKRSEGGKFKMEDAAIDLFNSDLITEEMLNEEKQLEENMILEQKKLRQQMMEQQKKMEEEQCFKRLTLLLSRSSIYAKFMAEKLQKKESLQEKQKQRLVAQEKAKETRKENDGAVINSSQTGRGVKRKSSSVTSDLSRKKKHSTVSIVDMFKREKDKISTVAEATIENAVTDKASDTPSEQPVLLTGGSLYPYQQEGYDWLRALYENGVNGILADEMGLGKTIQCIAFIAYLVEMKVNGPFFVCAPLSTLPNWYAEFKRFTPQIPIILYHGTKDVREKLRRQILQKSGLCYPVVLTSYQIALFDSNRLARIHWKMLVIDEAHRIKNFECKLVAELKRYNAVHRLLMTGTPLQNNLSELWSLLNFILPEIFDDLQVFQSWFDITSLTQNGANQEIVAKEQEKQIVSTIHQILTPFLLRRTKMDVNLGLPQKKEVIIHAPLSKIQEKYYTGALNKTIRRFFGEKEEALLLTKRVSKQTNFLGMDDVSTNLSNTVPSLSKCEDWSESELHVKLNSIIMCLRKICNHPYLISYPLDYTGQYRVDEDIVLTSGKLRVLDILLQELKKRGHKVLLFSQFVSMLEVLQDYCGFRGYKYSCLHGSHSLEERQNELKQFSEDADTFIFLISTKAGGLGLNIIAADTVIFYDSDWNPQGDIQAQDRCHRIGQTKPVVIYRLIVPTTADERVFDYAQTKRKLEKVIIKKGRFSSKNSMDKNFGGISREELLELLESSDFNSLVKTDDQVVLPQEELEKLLDRSDMIVKNDNNV